MSRTVPEVDVRFRNGSWVGYLVTPSTGAKRRASVAVLSFAGGVVTGTGSDEFGAFVLRGRYDVRDGKSVWVQTYGDRQEVTYTGYCDGQGIWGMWYRPREVGPDWKGGFHLVREGDDDATPLPLLKCVEPLTDRIDLGGAAG